jgi:hypothetical protein
MDPAHGPVLWKLGKRFQNGKQQIWAVLSSGAMRPSLPQVVRASSEVECRRQMRSATADAPLSVCECPVDKEVTHPQSRGKEISFPLPEAGRDGVNLNHLQSHVSPLRSLYRDRHLESEFGK